MKIAQAEILRLIDYNRICIRDINTALNNGSRQKDIIIIIDKIQNNLFQLRRLHLSVTDSHTAIRNVTLNHRFQFRQISYPVIDKKHLAVTAHFKINRIRNHLLIKGMHLCLDRITVRRRRRDNTQIARTHQRELKRTGNRSSGHCQCIHVHFQLPQLFLYRDSEFLFFINNQQSQVFKLDVFSQDTVSTYQYIDIPLLQSFQHSFRLCGRTCTAQIFHPARQSFQAVAECLEMLVSKHRSRHKHSHLFIIGNRLEGRTDGNLRLSKSHIPTDQTIHRTITLHIRLDINCRFALVRRIFINKGSFQLTLQETIRTIREALFLAALRIQLNQITGNIFYLTLCTLFQFLPRTRAQFIKSGSLSLFSFVFGNFVQRMNRNKYHIIILKNQFQDFLRSISIRNTHQTGETSDTMIRMHHIIARSKLVQFFQGKGHLSRTGFITLQIILMETVE